MRKVSLIGLGYVGLPLAVAHDSVKENIWLYSDKLIGENTLVMDIKGMFADDAFGDGVTLWRL